MMRNGINPGRLLALGVLATAGSSMACVPAASPPIGGINLAQLEFVPYAIDEGIHPDQSVLDDPNNPFAKELPSDLAGPKGEPAVKWNLAAMPVAAFYSWATFLARQPNGENQYYVAVNLAAIRQRLIDRNLDPPVQTLLADMAARAFQSVLVNFPGAVTYAANGVTTYELTPLAIQGIVALGKPIPAGWALVNGMAVRTR